MRQNTLLYYRNVKNSIFASISTVNATANTMIMIITSNVSMLNRIKLKSSNVLQRTHVINHGLFQNNAK